MNKTEKADVAFEVYSYILDTIPEETARIFRLGHLFKRIRDEELYKHLDSECDNFGQFCADPDIGYQRATIYAYIEIWEKYIEELHLDMDTLRKITYSRLRRILSVVDKNPDEWLSRAKTWSNKDLINAIRKEKGRQPMKEVKNEIHSVAVNGYLHFVTNSPCSVCGRRPPSERAHFPKTRGAGGGDTEVLPLCGKCHHIYHDIGIISFFDLYRNQIGAYFYELIDKLYEELNATK